MSWCGMLPQEHISERLKRWGGAVLLSPDGLLLASEDYKGIHLWNAKTGKRKKTIAVRLNYRSSMLFSPGGQTLAGAYSRGPIRTMECTETGKLQENAHRTYERTFIVCRSARMEKRSQVAVEIEPSDYGI